MNKKGYILYDTLMAITLILLFAVPISKASTLTELNIRRYQENHDLNEKTKMSISQILSSDYTLESDEYIVEDEIFLIYIESEDTEYTALKKINVSVHYKNDDEHYNSDYRNSAVIYKYIGEQHD